MPRGIFGMRLVLVVKVVCGSLVYAAFTLNAAL
ncbi:hypothetical protein VIVU109784_22765 [Vibrio vulnificus]